MKKSLKVLAALMALVFIALSLCSCQQLDDRRNDTARYLEGTKEALEFRGEKYVLFDEFRETSQYTYSYITDGIYGAYVVEGDVPVLLSTIYGASISFKVDEEHPVIIQAYTSVTRETDYPGVYYTTSDVYYCREDMVDEVQKIIDEKKYDEYFYYETDRWDEETNEYVWERTLLSDDASDAVRRTLKRDFNEKTDYTMDNVDNEIYDQMLDEIDISYCDKQIILTSDSYIRINKAYSYGNSDNAKYYIFCYENGVYDFVYKLVSEEDAAYFEELFDIYRYENGWYEDGYYYYYDIDGDLVREDMNSVEYVEDYV